MKDRLKVLSIIILTIVTIIAIGLIKTSSSFGAPVGSGAMLSLYRGVNNRHDFQITSGGNVQRGGIYCITHGNGVCRDLGSYPLTLRADITIYPDHVNINGANHSFMGGDVQDIRDFSYKIGWISTQHLDDMNDHLSQPVVPEPTGDGYISNEQKAVYHFVNPWLQRMMDLGWLPNGCVELIGGGSAPTTGNSLTEYTNKVSNFNNAAGRATLDATGAQVYENFYNSGFVAYGPMKYNSGGGRTTGLSVSIPGKPLNYWCVKADDPNHNGVNFGEIGENQVFYVLVDPNDIAGYTGDVKIEYAATGVGISTNTMLARIGVYYAGRTRVNGSLINGQDLVTIQPGSPDGTPREEKPSVTFKYTPRRLIITKYGLQRDGTTVDQAAGKLGEARFVIKKTDTNQYIKHPDGYNWIEHDSWYNMKSDDLVDASQFDPNNPKANGSLLFTNVAGQSLIITNIPDGEYEVTEVSPPPGYALSTNGKPTGNVHTTKFTKDEKEKSLNFHNPKASGITIRKYATDANYTDVQRDKGQLAGAWFTIKEEKQGYVNAKGLKGEDQGDAVEYQFGEFTADAGSARFTTGDASKGVENKGKGIRIQNLPAGSYTVTEVEAPPGYTIRDDRKIGQFIINEEGKSVNTLGEELPELHFWNAQNGSSIKIRKVDEDGNLLDGATVSVMFKDGRYVTADGKFTDKLVQIPVKGGEIELSVPEEGEYTVTEVTVPSGYESDGKEYKINVKGSGEHLVKIVNKKKKDTTIKIRKVDEKGNLLGGARIWLMYYDTSEFVTSNGQFSEESVEIPINGGEIEIHVPKSGKYVYQESQAPGGYKYDTKQYTIVVGNSGEYTITLRDEPDDDEGGKIKKVIEGTNVPLQGFSFRLEEDPIANEYPEIAANQCCSYNSEDEFRRCDYVDSSHPIWSGPPENRVIVGYRCGHGYGTWHIDQWNSDRAEYNAAIPAANRFHALRLSQMRQANQRGLTTDKNGMISISPLGTSEDDGRGLIYAIETDVGSNPYFDVDSTRKKLNYNGTTTLTNKRMRVDIEGRIWVDEVQGKDAKRNDWRDNNEKLLQPVEINLKHGNQVLAKGVLTEDGRYRIRLSAKLGQSSQNYIQDYFVNDSKNTYIEFTYNGVVYQSVIPLQQGGGSDRSSKAGEVPSERTNMNNDYARIRANDGSSSQSDRMTAVNNRIEYIGPQQYKSETRYEGGVSGSFTRNEKESEPIGDGVYTVSPMPTVFDNETSQTSVNMKDDGWSRNCHYIDNKQTKGKYQIRSTTQYANKDGSYDFIKGSGWNLGVDTIKNIDLGVYVREQPDLNVVNDIYQVRVETNGERYTYQYSSKTKDDTPQSRRENNNKYNEPAVKFSNNSNYKEYTREVYPSDVEIIPTDDNGNVNKSQEISVYVIYKTTIYNESSSLSTQPTQIVSYFDSNFVPAEGEQMVPKDVTYRYKNKDEYASAVQEVKWTTNGEGEHPVQTNLSKAYGTMSGGFIEPFNMENIYTEYRIPRGKIYPLLLNGQEGGGSLEGFNHVEINAYTTHLARDIAGNGAAIGSNYAGIDKDSQPGNMTPNNKDTYEDDNDDAPVFKLVLTENKNRLLEGNIFEDLPDLKTYTRNINGKSTDVIERVGNGKRDSSEGKVKNVKVEMIEAKYNQEEDRWEEKLDSSGQPVVTRLDSRNKEFICESGESGNRDSLELAERVTGEAGEDGYYQFYGFGPGRYLLRYTWGQDVENGGTTMHSVILDPSSGNKTPYVQQYKSAIFGPTGNSGKDRYDEYLKDRTSFDADGNPTNTPSRWYLSGSHKGMSNAIDVIDKTSGNGDTNRRAVDDGLMKINNTNNYNNYVDKDEYIEKIDSYPQDEKNVNTTNEDNSGDSYSFKNYATNSEWRKMYSKTVAFDIGFENLEDDNDNEGDKKDGKDDHRAFKISDVDFGITQRPNSNINLKKELNRATIFLANGQKLVDLDIKNNTASGVMTNTKYLKPDVNTTNSDIGVMHTEMDQELIHGATIQLEYKYTIKNESELDYKLQGREPGEGKDVGENRSDLNQYYKFGITEKERVSGAYPLEEVTMKATKIVDWLDNKMNFDENLEHDDDNYLHGEENKLWLRDEFMTDDKQGIYDKHEVYHESYYDGSYDWVANGHTEPPANHYIYDYARENEIPASDPDNNGEEFYVENVIKKKYWTLTREEQDERDDDNKGALYANEEKVEWLTVSKDLGSTTEEDMSYLNSAEVIKIYKTGGEYPGDISNDIDVVQRDPSTGTTVKKNHGGDPRQSTPGTQQPGNNPPNGQVVAELDSWTAEQVTITPPTGDDTDYLVRGWTIIGIISLGILGSGTYSIIRFIKRRKK